MRILGLDVGQRRIGVALSDELGITAQPLVSIDVKKLQGKPSDEIERLCKAHHVSKIVVGLPRSMDGGDRGISARRSKAFGAVLHERLGIDIVYWDERFSTVEAERVLIEGNVSRAHRKMVVDKIAASLILQGYLNAQ